MDARTSVIRCEAFYDDPKDACTHAGNYPSAVAWFADLATWLTENFPKRERHKICLFARPTSDPFPKNWRGKGIAVPFDPQDRERSLERFDEACGELFARALLRPTTHPEG